MRSHSYTAHAGYVPQFHSNTCMDAYSMCAPVWVCDINTSEGDFHHVFSGTLWGMALKWQSQHWGEPNWDVLLNPLSGWARGGVNPAMKRYLTLTKTAVTVAAVADRLTGVNWQSQPYKLNNTLPHTFHWVFILLCMTHQIKTVFHTNIHSRHRLLKKLLKIF